jgi:hypothetical protein
MRDSPEAQTLAALPPDLARRVLPALATSLVRRIRAGTKGGAAVPDPPPGDEGAG